MKCRQCGQELIENAHFCTNCGAPIPPETWTAPKEKPAETDTETAAEEVQDFAASGNQNVFEDISAPVETVQQQEPPAMEEEPVKGAPKAPPVAPAAPQSAKPASSGAGVYTGATQGYYRPAAAPTSSPAAAGIAKKDSRWNPVIWIFVLISLIFSAGSVYYTNIEQILYRDAIYSSYGIQIPVPSFFELVTPVFLVLLAFLLYIFHTKKIAPITAIPLTIMAALRTIPFVHTLLQPGYLELVRNDATTGLSVVITFSTILFEIILVILYWAMSFKRARGTAMPSSFLIFAVLHLLMQGLTIVILLFSKSVNWISEYYAYAHIISLSAEAVQDLFLFTAFTIAMYQMRRKRR